MKKQFSKIFAMLLIMALVFSSQASAVTPTSMDNQTDTFFPEDLLHDETFVISMWEELVYYHGEEYLTNLHQARENDNRLMSLLSDRARTFGGDDPVYPDFIGGIYYNADGNMVLQIVENLTSRDSILYDCVKVFVAEADGIITENVRFSYNELNATIDILNAFYTNGSKFFNNVELFGVNTRNNRIEIYLSVYSEEEINRFKNNVLDSPMIVFVESCEPIVKFNELRPGMGISGASVGYRVRHNATGNLGFVTTAHSVTPGQMYSFGTATNIWQFSGSVDAAFILSQRILPPQPPQVSNTIHLTGGTLPLTVQTTFRLGDGVAKVGGTTGWTHGEIIHVNTSANGLTGLIRTDARAAAGDSGGIVFMAPTILNISGNTAGLVQGGNASTMLFTRADRINSALGLSRR